MTTRLEDHGRFVSTVQQMARGLTWDEAQLATEAVLSTLAERLPAGGARDVARDLPEELRGFLETGAGTERFRATELVRRVAAREGLDDLDEARLHVRAVFDALRWFVPERELRQMESELSEDYLPLTAPMVRPRRPATPGHPAPLPVEDFLGRVANRAGTDVETAGRVAGAVLETLGERVAHGDVEELAGELAPELREPLEQGDAESGGRAERMSLDEFLRRIAEREGIDPDAAPDHVRAVFQTLREAVPEREIADLMAQLPRDYEPVLAGV